MRDDFFPFDYATIRLAPRVEREEFFNVGVIVSCPARKFLECRLWLDEAKLKAFAPEAAPSVIHQYLDIIPQICAGDAAGGIIGKLTQRERFYWLTAQRSTIVQSSPVHTGFCAAPRETLEKLFVKMVGCL